MRTAAFVRAIPLVFIVLLHPFCARAWTCLFCNVSLLFFSSWDIVIIEGWSATLHAFVATIRKRNPLAVVFYACFDSYPTPLQPFRLDVDAFITNSAMMQRDVLSLMAPTRLMQLAVDPIVFAVRSTPSVPTRYLQAVILYACIYAVLYVSTRDCCFE